MVVVAGVDSREDSVKSDSERHEGELVSRRLDARDSVSSGVRLGARGDGTTAGVGARTVAAGVSARRWTTAGGVGARGWAAAAWVGARGGRLAPSDA